MDTSSEDLQPAWPLRLTRGRHGLFLINENDHYIGRGLLEYGEYSELEMQTLAQLCAPGKDVIEIGANIGALSVPLAKKQLALGRRMLVVEPQPTIFTNLCANLALNGLNNVVTRNVACGNEVGECFAPEVDFGLYGNFGGVELHAERQSSSDLAVPCTILDQLVPESFDTGLIKIDVEGYELSVLQGAKATIERNRPILYVENDRRDQSAALIDWFWQADYELWWDYIPLFNKNNFRGKTDNLFVLPNEQGVLLSVYSQNMIAIPEERSVKVEGRKVLSLDDWCVA